MSRGDARDLFYRRPRLTVLTLALIVVSGLSALVVLPRSEDPELTSRNALVITAFPGATAERVESQVTDVLEEELAELEELHEVTSTSRAGVSVLSLEIADAITDVDGIWSRVRDELDDAAALLPAGALEPEFEDLAISAYTLTLGLVWTRDDAPNEALLARLAEELAERLRGVPGTAEVELYGEAEEEVLVTLEPGALAAHALSPDDVAAALAAADAKAPAGALRPAGRDLVVEVDGAFEALERVRAVPVARGADGALLRVGDLGRVEKTVADPPAARAVVDGRHAVLVAARMQSSQRVDRWTAAAREVVSEYEAALGGGLELVTLFEQDVYTTARLHGLVQNLVLGAGLVMAVVLLTLGLRSALVVGLALPLTTLTVLAALRVLGVPIHQMSVTGLIIALGLLIDNAIVLVDELRRFLSDEPEHSPAAIGRAIRRTVARLGVPLLGSTLTTVVAFLPLVLAPGPVGEFVGAMSVSVILAVLASFVLALTVLPALVGWLERRLGPPVGDGLFARGLQSARMAAAWRRALDLVLARPLLGVLVALALPLAGFVAATRLQEQFFPPSGRDQAVVELLLDEGTPLARTVAAADAAREALLAHPDVTGVDYVAGRSAPKFYYNRIEFERGTPHYADLMVHLATGDGTPRILRELQRLLDAAVPAAQALVRQLEQGPPFDAPVALRLEGADLAALERAGDEVRAALADVPGVTHTRTTLSTGRPQLRLAPSDEDLALAGLDRGALARRLAASLDGAVGGSMFEGTEELAVRVRMDAGARGDLHALAGLPLAVGSDAGAPRWTTLDALGELTLAPEAGVIPRHDRVRCNTVQGYLAAGVLPADALEGLLSRLEARGFEPPPGVRLVVSGEAAERDDAVANLAASASVLGVAMVAVLVLTTGSFRRAAVLGLVALLAVGLALGAVWLFGHPFGFMAIVGAMGLVGIALNDAMVVQSALVHDPASLAGDRVAQREVVFRATRHVLSTTLTTVVGFVPLLLAGEGLWPPLATAIAGGVVGATLLALTFVPATFAWTHRPPAAA